MGDRLADKPPVAGAVPRSPRGLPHGAIRGGATPHLFDSTPFGCWHEGRTLARRRRSGQPPHGRIVSALSAPEPLRQPAFSKKGSPDGHTLAVRQRTGTGASRRQTAV